MVICGRNGQHRASHHLKKLEEDDKRARKEANNSEIWFTFRSPLNRMVAAIIV